MIADLKPGIPKVLTRRQQGLAESRQILALALPISAAMVAQMLMGVTDAVMMGRINAEALAAGGLAANIGFLLVMLGQGVINGIQPLIATAEGAGDRAGHGAILCAGVILALAASAPIILVLWHLRDVLLALGEPLPIAEGAARYTAVYIYAVPVSLVLGVCRTYLSAISRPVIVMLTGALALFGNFGLNWILVFGHAGFPAYGLPGSAAATALTWGVMSLVLGAAVLRQLPGGWVWPARRAVLASLGDVVRIGWPIAVMMLVEIGLFSGSSLVMGRFGAVALAAHQICLNLASLVFMIPLSLSQAATVRVGFYRGAGQPASARRAGLVAIGLGILAMGLTSALLLVFARPLFTLFLDTGDPNSGAVLALGTQLVAVAVMFQLFDGVQAVSAGALRGMQDTRAVMLAGVIGYWGLGLPAGLGLAFYAGLGPVGLWWGFACGLAALATMLSLRFWRISKSPA